MSFSGVILSLVSLLGIAEASYVAPAGVFYAAPESIHSSSGCSSVLYYQGERVGETTLYRLDDQDWDLERAVVYSPELQGCVQCAADRYFSMRPGQSQFFGPVNCLQCRDGLFQDAAGTDCTVPMEACPPPLMRNSYGICSCPPFTEMKPGNYCACADPAATTEYGLDNRLECICPPETRLVQGQCLCPRNDQVYDPEHGWCVGCPHPLVADGNRCVYRSEPTIKARCKAGSERWFYRPQALKDYVQKNVIVEGSGPEASVDVYQVEGTCQDAAVPYAVSGDWGTLYRRMPVKYDPSCPVVNITVRYDTLDWKSMALADVGFEMCVSSLECDHHPNVTLSLYSNQVNLDCKQPTAQITPIYDSYGYIKNFQVFLRARHFFKCNQKKGRLCMNKEGEGRLYLMRVCVTTEAGCKSCDVTKVEIPIHNAMVKHKKKSYFVVPKKIFSYSSGSSPSTSSSSTKSPSSPSPDTASYGDDDEDMQEVENTAPTGTMAGAAAAADDDTAPSGYKRQLLSRSRRLQEGEGENSGAGSSGGADEDGAFVEDDVGGGAGVYDGNGDSRSEDGHGDGFRSPFLDDGDGGEGDYHDGEGSGDESDDLAKSRSIVSMNGVPITTLHYTVLGSDREDGHAIEEYVGGNNAFYLLQKVEGTM